MSPPGAVADKPGRFELASEGTLFLDEIGELPLTGQVKLLRVLEAHEIQRVGSDEAISVDTRIVAATNLDLESAVSAGGFRQDLFARLSHLVVKLPPLWLMVPTPPVPTSRPSTRAVARCTSS